MSLDLNEFSFAALIILVDSESLLVQRRIIVESFLHDVLERFLTLASLSVTLQLAVIRFLFTWVQVLKSRVIVALVSKLLHNQLLDSMLNVFNLSSKTVHTHSYFVVLGLLNFDFLVIKVVSPLLSLTAGPDTLLDFELLFVLLVRNNVVADTMLFSSLPLTVVGTTISPEVDTLSTLLVVDILTHEHTAIAPAIGSFTMHHVVLPVSKVQPVIVPHEETLTVQHVVLPLADVSVTVRPAILTLTLLRSVLIEAHVLTTIVPLLLAKAVLFVLIPVADVLATVGVFVDTEALRHVVNKLALVQVTTGVVQLSTAIVEVVLPETLINSTVGPSHDSIALLHVGTVLQHLTRVDRALLRVVIDAHVVHSQQLA